MNTKSRKGRKKALRRGCGAQLMRLAVLNCLAGMCVYPASVSASIWTKITSGSAGGAWTTSSNWSGGVPNSTGAVADFSTLNISQNSTVTLSSAVSVGSLVFGDTTPTNDWTVTGGTITLAVSSGTPTLTVSNRTVTLSPALVGSAGLQKTGSGTAILAGGTGSTLSGVLQINAGTLKSTDGVSFKNVVGRIAVASGAAFYFGQNFLANNLTNALTLSGSGLGGYGALNLSYNATASGSVTLNADTTVTHDWNNSTISGPITGAGTSLQLITLAAGQPGLVVSGPIQTGSGGLSVTGTANTGGSGSVTTFSVKLSASNAFTGGVTINDGTLLVADPGALNSAAGSENGVSFGAATSTGKLTIGGNSVTISALNSNATLGTPAVENSGTALAVLTVGNSQNLDSAYAGVIQDGVPSSGSAGALSLKKAGLGTLHLSNSNTYSGGTTLSAGTLIVDTLGSLGGGAVNMGGTATLRTTVSGTFTNQFVLAAGAAGSIDTNGLAITLQGAITGAGGLQKAGGGTLTLGGGTMNSFSGGIQVVGGTLSLSSGLDLKNATGTITVGSGATFNVAGNFTNTTLPANWIVSGSGDSAGLGALRLSQNVTLSGSVTLAGDTLISHDWNNGTLTGNVVGIGKNLILNSSVSGQPGMTLNGNITLGSGTLTKTGVNLVSLGGTNSFAAALVNQGVLYFGKTAAMGGTGCSITIQSNAVAALNGADLNPILSLVTPSSAGAIAFASGSAATAALNLTNYPALSVGAYSNTVYSGTITAGGGNYRLGGGGATLTLTTALSGTNGLIVNDAQGGSVVLAGSHPFSGATAVNAGTLAADGTLSGPVTVSSGGTLAPGPANGTGSLTLLAPLVVNGNLSMQLNRSGTQTADLLTAPSLVLTGTLGVVNSGTALQLGDAFHLLAISGSTGQSGASLSLPSLGSGLAWDVTGLLSTGTLKVIAQSSTVGTPDWPGYLASQVQTLHDAGYSSITINPGTYLLPDVSGASFTWNSWSNFSVNAQNVLMIVGKQQAFQLNGCSNVTLSGVTIRAHYPSFIQGRVLSKGTNANGKAYAMWRISDGYPAFSGTGGWFNAVNQTSGLIDLVTGDCYNTVTTSQGNNTWKLDFTTRTSLPFSVNDWLVSRLVSGEVNQDHAVYLTSCTNCTIQSVTSQSGGFATFFEQGGGGNHLLNCRIQPSPVAPDGGTDLPVVSCAADGFHSGNAYPGPDIEGMVCQGAMLDDCIAIHGNYQTALSVSGSTVVFDGPGQFVVGDPVRIGSSSGFFAQAICTDLQDLGDGTFQVSLDQTLAVPVGARASNPNYNGAGFRLINNVLGNTRSRAIITKADNGLISNCTIANAGSAVQIGPEYYWNESDYSWNVTVDSNSIGNCSSGINVVGEGAIGNMNIALTNNSLGSMLSGNGINVKGCDGLTVTGNAFATPVVAPAIYLFQCSNVSFENNLVSYASGAAALLSTGTAVSPVQGASNGILYSMRGYALNSSLSGLLLANPFNGPAGTAPQQFSECNAAGRWKFAPAGGGYCQIVSSASGLVLAVTSTSASSVLILSNTSGVDTQLWTLGVSGTAALNLINKASGLAASVQTTLAGESVSQTALTGSTSQAWIPAIRDLSYSTWVSGTASSSNSNGSSGLTNFMEYALGSATDFSGKAPAPALSPLTVSGTTAKYLTLSLKRRVSATDVVFHVDASTDLWNWFETAVQVSSTANLDGTTTELWRFPAALQSGTTGFLRVRVTSPN